MLPGRRTCIRASWSADQVSIVQLRTKLQGREMMSHRVENGIGRQEMTEETNGAVARDVRDVNTETLE
jgi:hypothetical protein